MELEYDEVSEKNEGRVNYEEKETYDSRITYMRQSGDRKFDSMQWIICEVANYD